jgi:drug/metabolite transporter (DMT)-like permease
VLALGLAAAVGASVLFNLGVALQALEARRAPREEGLRVSLLARLLRRRRWVAGLLLGGLGFPLEVLAFADAPFVVVQPALAAGLLLLLFLGKRTLGEHVRAVDVAGVLAIVCGIALVAWGAPTHTETHRAAVAVVGVVAALSVLALAPLPVRGTRLDTAMLAILASACGFAASNVATKLMGDDVNVADYVHAALWLLIAAATGIVAILTEMTALQRRRATTVVPVSFAVQTFLPIVLEPLFLRERWSTAELDGAPLVVGLLLVLAGTVLISSTRAVSVLAGGDGVA